MERRKGERRKEIGGETLLSGLGKIDQQAKF